MHKGLLGTATASGQLKPGSTRMSHGPANTRNSKIDPKSKGKAAPGSSNQMGRQSKPEIDNRVNDMRSSTGVSKGENRTSSINFNQEQVFTPGM